MGKAGTGGAGTGIVFSASEEIEIEDDDTLGGCSDIFDFFFGSLSEDGRREREEPEETDFDALRVLVGVVDGEVVEERGEEGCVG